MEARECSSIDATYRYGQLTLEIVNGLHRGARHAMAGQQLALIGRHPDCDLVLSDPSVAPQHCLISRAGDQLIVRPVGGIVILGTVRLQLGETRLWPAHLPLQLGQVSLVTTREALIQSRSAQAAQTDVENPEAHSTAHSMQAAVAETAAIPPSAPATRRSWLVRGVLWGVCGVMTAWAVQAFQPVDVPDSVVTGAVAELAMTSVVDAGAVHAERQPSSLAAANRRGDDRLATNVKEILRLSGVVAHARDLGDGKVEVRAHFPSGTDMTRIIQSRAMRDVRGLREVVAINLSEQTSLDPEPSDDALTVQTVVAGADPYLVASDGSRYYPGAHFPNGQRLVAIEGQEIILDAAGHTLRANGPGTAMGKVTALHQTGNANQHKEMQQ